MQTYFSSASSSSFFIIIILQSELTLISNFSFVFQRNENLFSVCVAWCCERARVSQQCLCVAPKNSWAQRCDFGSVVPRSLKESILHKSVWSRSKSNFTLTIFRLGNSFSSPSSVCCAEHARHRRRRSRQKHLFYHNKYFIRVFFFIIIFIKYEQNAPQPRQRQRQQLQASAKGQTKSFRSMNWRLIKTERNETVS